MNIVIHILTFIVALTCIWVGAGLIVNAIEKLSERMHMSPFIVSFFVLGTMTSIPEISIGVNALRQGEPEIFTGNLLGASVVLFLLIIPVFGILGNGVKLNHDISNKSLIVFLLYILLPSLLLVDGTASIYDGIILVLYYIGIFFFTYRKSSLKEEVLYHLKKKHSIKSFKELFFIVVGLAIVLIASNVLVSETEYFAGLFEVSELVLSLLILSIGTNVPELSLAIRTAFSGKKDIAFGNYLGSAVANSLILGTLILLQQGYSVTSDLKAIVIAVLGGLGLFYVFSRSQNELSRKECLVLLFGYFIFVLYEVAFKI